MIRLNAAGALRRLAQAVRHAPGLSGMEWLWNAARAPYQRILRASKAGVAVTLGGRCTVTMPGENAVAFWETYEVEEIRRVAQWVEEHPGGLLLDVGCARGIYSLLGLCGSRDLDVVAFDSDLPSLKATLEMCRLVKGDRLRVIHGFVTDRHATGLDVDAAVRATQERLDAAVRAGELGKLTYRCLSGDPDASIPVQSLDGLWEARGFPERPILLKCDVEGAEQLILNGAPKFLARKSTTLSLSVHPTLLPPYGHSAAGVRRFLEACGYGIEVLAVDHEEHWWCERRAARA